MVYVCAKNQMSYLFQWMRMMTPSSSIESKQVVMEIKLQSLSVNPKIWKTIFFGTSELVARFNLLDFSLEVEFSIVMMVKFLSKAKIEYSSVIRDAQSNPTK